jgi:hypothetical protein
LWLWGCPFLSSPVFCWVVTSAVVLWIEFRSDTDEWVRTLTTQRRGGAEALGSRSGPDLCASQSQNYSMQQLDGVVCDDG